MGYPIRESPVMLVRQLTEAFRSLTTPFIGHLRQGIHRGPVLT